MANYKFCRTIILVLGTLFILSLIISCGEDDIDRDDILEKPSASLISAVPPNGVLTENGSITLTFDSSPGRVKASSGTISGTGKTRTITGPFEIGSLSIKLEWSNDRKSIVLNYNVPAPPDITVPSIVNSTIKNGDKAVNPEEINKNGIIKVNFDEWVTGKLLFQREDGLSMCWSSEVNSPDNSLMLVYDDSRDDCQSQLLDYETVYVIQGMVSDAAGNENEVRITFVTKAHEDPTVGDPIITIVFRADDFNHHEPGIWAYQLHTDGLLKKDIFVAVEYTYVFNVGAHHFKNQAIAGGWNKWSAVGNSLIKKDLVFIPKHATFSEILQPSALGWLNRDMKHKHLNGMLIEVLPWDRGWVRYFGNNPFNKIGVIGGGWNLLSIDVGKVTPRYAVGNPSKAELWR